MRFFSTNALSATIFSIPTVFSTPTVFSVPTIFLIPTITAVLSLCHSPSAFAHGGAIEEVIVISTRDHRTLDDSPLRIEVLGEEELREKANMKPGDIRMMLNESTGIQVQQTSATSFNSTVRIQGLDGRYTQMLRDGLPIYSGFSNGLSLLQIPPLDLKQVEVIKGASSTLHGAGAIAGLVNLISKTPEEEPKTAIMLNATSADGQDLSAFHSRQKGDHGFTLFTSYNRNSAYDPANNGLSAIPKFERFTLTPRWFYSASEQTQLDVGLGFTDEDRLGGSMDYIKGRSQEGYFEENTTRRTYVRLGLAHEHQKGYELSFKHTSSRFDRRLATPNTLFSGLQTSSFNEATIGQESAKGSWLLGLNFTSDEFDQDKPLAGFVQSYSENTTGAFAQYTRDISTALVFDSGIRIDSHSNYGEFILPRFSFLFLPADDLTLRLGGGLGYKTPSLFIADAEEENFQNIKPINPDNFDAEKSSGANFDINYRHEFTHDFAVNSNLLFFYTEVDKPVELVQRENFLEFAQSNNKVSSQGLETNLVFSWHELRYFLGYTLADTKNTNGSNKAPLNLVSKHRLNQVLIWEKEDDFRIGLEAYYFSPQQRENNDKGKSYWVYGLMTEKKLFEHTTAFLNFENFTDTRQTKFENINSGNLINPQLNNIYAPLDGFVINGGFRITW